MKKIERGDPIDWKRVVAIGHGAWCRARGIEIKP